MDLTEELWQEHLGSMPFELVSFVAKQHADVVPHSQYLEGLFLEVKTDEYLLTDLEVDFKLLVEGHAFEHLLGVLPVPAHFEEVGGKHQTHSGALGFNISILLDNLVFEVNHPIPHGSQFLRDDVLLATVLPEVHMMSG